MKVFVTSTALALLSLFGSSVADHYALADSWTASNFFNGFNFYTGNDPTHGFVNYIDQGTAQNTGLINTNNNRVYIGVDYKTTNPGGRGRNSVRLESKKQYTHGLFILDLNHMPSNICGVWPAFWTYGPNWPNSGEIDILEGVNSQTTDFVTLHTSDNCKATSGAGFNGQLTANDCSVSTGGGTGCSIHSTNTATYGAGLNNVGGGVYAMEWGSWGIKVTFFARNNIPSDITNGAPQPSTWPQPMAFIPSNGNCNIDSHFANHWVVFDTTFCGDWAGDQNVWNADSTCRSKASTCQAYVAGNPSAFQQAYWDINSLKIYQGAPNKEMYATSPNATVEAVKEPSFILSGTSTHAMGPNGGSIGSFKDSMKQGNMSPGRNWQQGASKRHLHGHGAHGKYMDQFF